MLGGDHGMANGVYKMQIYYFSIIFTRIRMYIYDLLLI